MKAFVAFLAATTCVATACGRLYGEDGDQQPPVDLNPDAGDSAPSTEEGSTRAEDAATSDAQLLGDGSVAPCSPTTAPRFIDHFDDTDLVTPFWTRAVTSAGTLTFEDTGGVGGSRSLVAAVPLATTGPNRAAYLSLARGRLDPTSWTFCLSFAMKLVSPTTGYVTGPRLIASSDLNSASVIFAVEGRALYLSQFSDGCADGGTECNKNESDLIMTLDDQWTTLRLEGRAGRSESTFGSVTVTAGSTVKTLPIKLNLFGYPFTGVRVGVTRAGNNESATLRFDDVVYGDSLP